MTQEMEIATWFNSGPSCLKVNLHLNPRINFNPGFSTSLFKSL